MSLTDKINALTAYANGVTGESDTTLSEAVHTLADGYGHGGGDSIWNKIVDRTVTEVNDKDGLCKAVGDYAFRTCGQLTSAIFPSVTSIGQYGFYECTSLATADFPSVTTIGEEAFRNCALVDTNFPRATSAGSKAFIGCVSLPSIDMPLLKSVPFGFCQNARELVSARFPSATDVANQSFSGCAKLSSVDLSSATTLNSSAFANCSSLAVVDLPSVASILAYVFTGCKALKALILRKSDAICTLASYTALNGTPIKSGTGYIYVPSSLIETYKTASQWSTFAAQFRALEDYTVDGTITGDLDPNKI